MNEIEAGDVESETRDRIIENLGQVSRWLRAHLGVPITADDRIALIGYVEAALALARGEDEEAEPTQATYRVAFEVEVQVNAGSADEARVFAQEVRDTVEHMLDTTVFWQHNEQRFYPMMVVSEVLTPREVDDDGEVHDPAAADQALPRWSPSDDPLAKRRNIRLARSIGFQRGALEARTADFVALDYNALTELAERQRMIAWANPPAGVHVEFVYAFATAYRACCEAL